MRIVIVGGGVVGYSLAEHLLRDGHHLSLIEQNPKLSQELSEKLDVQILTGSGSSPEILKEAEIDSADMVLAVTPIDEVNIVVCAIAAQYDVKRRIARLRNREFSETSSIISLEKLGITSVIHPEQVLVDHLLHFVQTPHAVESANFENNKILLRGYRITENMELAGKTPLEIRQMIAPDIVLFAALVRDGKGMIPGGDTRFEPGDLLYSLFPHTSLTRFLQLVGIENKKSMKIIITGDSFSTLELAETLDKSEHSITLVDPSIEHARVAADRFHNIQVINGDCTMVDLLKEINIDSASFFIACSDAPDYNMLSALLAKAEGAHEVIAVSTETQHDKLFQSIGIDHVVNPRLTTAREILEIIARGQIGAVVQLSDVDIQAVRYIVEPDTVLVGKQIKNIARKLKRGTIVGIIVRGNSMMLPDGETTIEANDHVIMITRQKNLPSLNKLFKQR